MRGKLFQHPFLAVALPILLVGGIGGTLYHGLRNWVGFFLMDVIPIYLLGLAVCVYWWIRLGPKISHLLIMIGTLALLQLLGQWQLPPVWAINVSYASLALLILVPLTIIFVAHPISTFGMGRDIARGVRHRLVLSACRHMGTAAPADGHALALAHLRRHHDSCVE